MQLIKFCKLFHRISHPHDALALPPCDRTRSARFGRLHEYPKPQFAQSTSVDNSTKKSVIQPPPEISLPKAKAGYLPVHVGDDKTKYLIKAKHLNNPLFADLLERSAEEHGYSQSGILRIWCDAKVFESVLTIAAATHKRSLGRFSQVRVPSEKASSCRLIKSPDEKFAITNSSFNPSARM